MFTEDEKQRFRSDLLRSQRAPSLLGISIHVTNNREACPENCPVPSMGMISLDEALKTLPLPNACLSRDGHCRCCYIPVNEEPRVMVDRLKRWMTNQSSEPEIEQWHKSVNKPTMGDNTRKDTK